VKSDPNSITSYTLIIHKDVVSNRDSTLQFGNFD
jgi:hypothetical protein